MNTDKHYLVLTNKACQSLRSLTSVGATEADARGFVIGLLKVARLVGAFHDDRGEVQTWSVVSGSVVLNLEIVIAIDRAGRPKIAPDGKKRIVFFTDVR